MTDREYVEHVVTLSERLTDAERERQRADMDRSAHWRSDTAGRRARGAKCGRWSRLSQRAMGALIAAVQSPDAPQVVRDHFRINGPTYYEAARSATNMLHRTRP